MIRKILAYDNNLIVYRKELNLITGSVLSTILLQQCIYWDNINEDDEFYKFIEPCMHEKYKDGDSWTEELGFTKREFQTAYKKLEDLKILYKRVTRDRVTYYKLNVEILEKLLIDLYLSEQKTEDDVVPSKSTNTHLAKVTYVPSKSTNPHLVYSKNKSRDYAETTQIKKYIKKDFRFSLGRSEQFENLSEEYKLKLKAYSVKKDGSNSYDNFLDYHMSKGSRFKDWSRAYNTWISNKIKFDKVNPSDYIRTIQHSELGELFVEYGTNKLYNVETLEYVGIFKEKKQLNGEKEKNSKNNRVSGEINSILEQLGKNKRI